MGHFWLEFIRWKKYWGTALFAASLAIAVIDFVRPDLYFRRVFFKIWLVFWILVLASLVIRNILTPYWQTWIRYFEKRREQYIRQRLEDDASFTTLCCECRYYNHRAESCSRLRANKRIKWIKLNGYDKYEYCLYWQW